MANLNWNYRFVPFLVFSISSKSGREESISSVMEKKCGYYRPCRKRANPALNQRHPPAFQVWIIRNKLGQVKD